IRPWLFLPAWVGSDSVSVFSGSLAVTSSKPEMVMNLLPGLVGLNFLSGIFLYAPEQPFDLLAFTERDDGLLPTGGVADRADAAQAAPALAAHGDCVDVSDLDALGLVLVLEGLLDLGLARRLRDPERVPPLRVQLVGPLGDDRADHDFGGGACGHEASFSAGSGAIPLGRVGLPKFSSSSSRQSFASNW